MEERIDQLVYMNDYIVELGDDDIYEEWAQIVPDDVDWEDFIFITTDDYLWSACCRLFSQILAEL